MDSESSNKFIGSLTKFLQSLCNGYVEFDDGVELIGHIYLSVDAGKSGKSLNYFLNEKVCKNDNSVTFISNSFHAQPESKKAAAGGEGRRDDGEAGDSPSLSRGQLSSRVAGSPGQSRSGVHAGTKRPGSPLKGPPSQRRASTPPSQRRMQSPAAKGPVGSPASKTVPSSPSSSSQDNIPSSPARKGRSETSQPPSNQSDTANADGESDIIPSNILSINPPPEFASFLGSLTSDNQNAQDRSSPPDTKPDTDVTFIKEEFVSEPSSCAQAGSGGQHSGRSGDDGSGLYPVMLHQNTSVFPSTSAGYPPGYQGGASATATSQHPGFPGASSQSDPFSPVPGTSQDGADPSGLRPPRHPTSRAGPQTAPHHHRHPWLPVQPPARFPLHHHHHHPLPSDVFTCPVCGRVITNKKNIARHRRKCEQKCHLQCGECGEQFHRRDYYQRHLWKAHLIHDTGPRRLMDDVSDVVTEGSQSGWQGLEELEEGDEDVSQLLHAYVDKSSSMTSSARSSTSDR